MPLVSIITPTFNRAELLPTIWECVRAQSFSDFEWLVLDDSPQPAPIFDAIGDARVRYMHVPNRMTIGAKRNALCEAAGGEVVALFDDDDFYAPHYIADMLSLMDERSADFVKLFGFFLYARQHEVFAYWDLEKSVDVHDRFVPRPKRKPRGSRAR